MKTKKIVSFVLAASMLAGTSTTALAKEPAKTTIPASVTETMHAETIHSLTGEYNNALTIKTLYDLSGNSFELIETGQTGYYIFDTISGKYLEQAPESPSPYLGLSGNLYYFGPLNYYQKVGNTYKHTVLSDEYDFTYDLAIDMQNDFDSRLENSRETPDATSRALMTQESINEETLQAYFAEAQAATNSYIPNYTYVKDAIYPANKNGTCGYTAACIVLNYWHKVKSGIIDSSFLDSNGNLLTTGYTLQDKLVDYGGSDSSWGKIIRDALVDYCNDYGVSASSTYYITNWDIFAEVNSGRPVIVFGYFPSSPSPVTRGNVFHAVTAYGTQRSGLVSKLIVHYGWSGYEHVLLDSGLVGSSTQFVPK